VLVSDIYGSNYSMTLNVILARDKTSKQVGNKGSTRLILEHAFYSVIGLSTISNPKEKNKKN
jgi:hypothetical protein